MKSNDLCSISEHFSYLRYFSYSSQLFNEFLPLKKALTDSSWLKYSQVSQKPTTTGKKLLEEMYPRVSKVTEV